MIATVMDSYCWIGQVNARRARPRQRAIFIGASKPTEVDHVSS